MFSSAIERLNDRRNGAGEAGEDAGFTLIELMVVLLIMAILLAIAIPTFLGVSGSANDRAAQSNLNTALTNAKSYYQSNGQTFTGTNVTSLASALGSQEPSISWVTGPSTGSGVVSVGVATDGNGIVLASLSKTNTCWYLVDNEAVEASTTGEGVPSAQLAAGTWYGATAIGGSSSTACTAASASSAANWNTAGTAGFPAK
ncbi:MAG: type II secretion system protein [Acidimicrobiales bacterium]|jgi:type IV pilus assembly protein PilA